MTAGKNDLLATALSYEARLWRLANDHAQLQSMWDARITKESHGLTDSQAKAVVIAQAFVFTLATQLVALREAREMASLLRAYAEIKGSL